MASRAQIASIARRIEALRPSGPLTLIVKDEAETEQQALARYEARRGRILGPIAYVVTGVPRGGLDDY